MGLNHEIVQDGKMIQLKGFLFGSRYRCARFKTDWALYSWIPVANHDHALILDRRVPTYYAA